MNNKVLYTLDLTNSQISDVTFKDHESMTLHFTSGKVVTIRGEHDQDCCENVYADYSIIGYYKPQLMDKDVDRIVIKGVHEMGFLVCIHYYYNECIKIFIPCYNFQNGYYSSNLSLWIGDEKTSKLVDISEMVEDHIN